MYPSPSCKSNLLRTQKERGFLFFFAFAAFIFNLRKRTRSTSIPVRTAQAQEYVLFLTEKSQYAFFSFFVYRNLWVIDNVRVA